MLPIGYSIVMSFEFCEKMKLSTMLKKTFNKYVSLINKYKGRIGRIGYTSHLRHPQGRGGVAPLEN